MNITAALFAKGKEQIIRQLNSVVAIVSGRKKSGKNFTFGFRFEDLPAYPAVRNDELRVLKRETISISSEDNPFGKNKARLVTEFNCRDATYDDGKSHFQATVQLFSPELTGGSLYILKGLCNVERRAFYESFIPVDRNKVGVQVRFSTKVPLDLVNQITAFVIRIRRGFTTYPPYAVTRFIRGKEEGLSALIAKQNFKIMRKNDPFDYGLRVTGVFNCKDKKSQGRNLSTFEFTFGSSELGEVARYRVLGTCGIKREASFRNKGAFVVGRD